MIAPEVLGRYAADAAREVAGVQGLVGGARARQRSVRVTEEDGALAVELRLAVVWGADIPILGESVQRHVHEYLGRMSGLPVSRVDVVVDEVAAPASAA